MNELPHLRGYQLHEDLGPSRLGRAYRATQLHLGRETLVKILDEGLLATPLAQARFQRGMSLSAKIRHKNIVSLYAAGLCPDSRLRFLALEFVAGSSLEDLVRRVGRLPEERVLAIGLGVAEALACLEEHGIVQRHLTPHTILLDLSGRPKLSDLGLARYFGDRLTGPHRTLNSSPYAAPELALGSQLDSRSDLYSLGVVLYELLTGRLPPEGAPADPRLYLSLRSETSRFVARLCEVEPAARYQSAQEAVDTLRELSAGSTALALPPPEPTGRFLINTEADWTKIELKIRAQWPGSEVREEVFVRAQVMIGRGNDCDLRLPTPVISRRHAELSWQGQVLWLVPHSRTNPTCVNGEECASPLPLQSSDRITLSREVEIEVSWGGREEPEVPEEESSCDAPALCSESRARCTTSDAYFALGSSGRPAAPGRSSPARARLNHRVRTSPRLEIPSEKRVLALKSVLQVGSALSCELRLDPEAPRKALIVGPGSSGSWLLNVGPDPAAVRVNGQQIPDRCVLRSGDQIALYECLLIYREG